MRQSIGDWAPLSGAARDAYAAGADDGLRMLRATYAGAVDLMPGPQEPLTGRRLAELVAAAMHFASGTIDHHIPVAEAANRRKVACKSGCAFCCYQHVFLSTPELAVLAFAILGGPDGDEARRVVGASAAAIAPLSREERYRRGVPCPLLDRRTRRCQVYELRPFACRGHFSLSRLACERDFRDRMDPKKPARVPMLPTMQMAGVMAGIAVDVLCAARGLEMEQAELAQGLDRMMAPGVLDGWLAGERHFGDIGLDRRGDGASWAQVIASAAGKLV